MWSDSRQVVNNRKMQPKASAVVTSSQWETAVQDLGVHHTVSEHKDTFWNTPQASVITAWLSVLQAIRIIIQILMARSKKKCIHICCSLGIGLK